MRMRSRWFVLAAFLALVPAVARADIHNAAIWMDLDCYPSAWVTYHVPLGSFHHDWSFSDGGTLHFTDTCSVATGCDYWEAEIVSSGSISITKHTVHWSYIGDEPPDDLPYYTGGGCGE
jgi:hypothetical protein